MSEELQAFIQRVEDFSIDPGDKSLRFVDRLARENSWTLAFAERVEAEYKRFCILAMRAGHPVTPSEEVDQAWHLHLTYTRSYWDRFCGETLDAPLHHEPTSGGPSEGEKFRDWYGETLASYERLFGEKPPGDVWPSADQRFKHAGDWKWVNVGRYWMIPRSKALFASATALLIAMLVIAPGCTNAIAGGPIGQALLLSDIDLFPLSLGGTEFVMFYFVVCAIAVVASIFFRLREQSLEIGGAAEKPIPELNADELAVLAGGGKRLAQVSVTRLHAMGAISAKKGIWSWKLEAQDAMPKVGGLDRDIFLAIRSGSAIDKLYSVAKLHYARIDNRLQQLGLRRAGGTVVVPAACVSVAVIALGLLRLMQGISTGNSIGFLVILLVIYCIISAVLCIKSSRSTAHGDHVLKHYQERTKATKASLGAQTDCAAETDTIAICVAVLGTSAIAGVPGLNSLSSAFPRVNTWNSGGGGCGAGCSGGGGCGGGGCGGCGGCGG